MQRWTVLLFLGLVALAVLVVTAEKPDKNATVSAEAASASGSASSAQGPIIMAPTSLPAPALPALDLDAGTLPPLADEPNENADAGATLSDGAPVPKLAADAPKQVIFGVILLQYRGAQGASREARSRDDALALATQLATEGKGDFAAAARKGDTGMENAGTMMRGVLEPGPEYTLFSLEVGGVSAPVDSPRGFYVFKRIE